MTDELQNKRFESFVKRYEPNVPAEVSGEREVIFKTITQRAGVSISGRSLFRQVASFGAVAALFVLILKFIYAPTEDRYLELAVSPNEDFLIQTYAYLYESETDAGLEEDEGLYLELLE